MEIYCYGVAELNRLQLCSSGFFCELFVISGFFIQMIHFITRLHFKLFLFSFRTSEDLRVCVIASYLFFFVMCLWYLVVKWVTNIWTTLFRFPSYLQALLSLTAFRPAVGPTQLHAVTGKSFSWVKVAGACNWHSPLSGSEVSNVWKFTSNPPYTLK
jgi:hypothetical protein